MEEEEEEEEKWWNWQTHLAGKGQVSAGLDLENRKGKIYYHQNWILDGMTINEPIIICDVVAQLYFALHLQWAISQNVSSFLWFFFRKNICLWVIDKDKVESLVLLILEK